MILVLLYYLSVGSTISLPFMVTESVWKPSASSRSKSHYPELHKACSYRITTIIFCRFQVHSDNDRYQEGEGIVDVHVGLVIGCLEQENNEQVIQYHCDEDSCKANSHKIREREVSCPEPPKGDHYHHRGAEG